MITNSLQIKVTLKTKKTIISKTKDILERDKRVVFAYIYGSILTDKKTPADMDIAIYITCVEEIFMVSSDLKIDLAKATKLSPDLFDIRIINELLSSKDAFSLLYLKNVFQQGRLLVDKDFGLRAQYLERYSLKYRESEGILDEVLT